MKLHEKAAANALAVVSATYYIVCTLLVFVAPDFYKNAAASWAHGADLSQIWRSTPPDAGVMLWGFITFTAASWVSGYFAARMYNYFVK